MKIYRGSDKVAGKLKHPIVTLGVFDGIHLGHQQLLNQCRLRARQLHSKAVAYTFEPHPVRVLFPEACPPLLTTTDQKLELLEQQGMDICVVEPFTKRFSRLKPATFFERTLLSSLDAQQVIVGYDFTFGMERRGTTATLKELGQQHDVQVTIVEAYLKDGHLVSSTVARKQIQDGEVELVQLLLGRPYFIDGTVIAGDGMGHQLGFPTANLDTNNELLPLTGVYATRTRVGNRHYNSVTNIGTRPTFKGRDLRIETHLLRFNRDIKGQKIRLEFLKRLRVEKPFRSPEELIAQINKDISRARHFFEGMKQ